jgi:hypothetical protein
MVIMFIAWYIAYLYIDKVQEAKAEKLRAEAEEMGKAAEKYAGTLRLIPSYSG